MARGNASGVVLAAVRLATIQKICVAYFADHPCCLELIAPGQVQVLLGFGGR